MTLRPPICQRDFKDPSLRAHGCTLASLAYLRRDAGKAGWSEAGLRQLQKRSGATRVQFLARGTTLREAQKAYMASPFTGRTAPRTRRLSGGSVRDDLLPELREGRLALVAVNYGVVVDANLGVGSFRGGHAVVAGDPDGDSVAIADPLRRQVIRWPIALLVKAMERFGGKPWLNGRGEALVAYPSPTWAELYKGQRDTARAEAKEWEKKYGNCQSAWSKCEARPPVPTDPAAIAAARAQGIADAAAAAGAVV